jgi:hypothetical protein
MEQENPTDHRQTLRPVDVDLFLPRIGLYSDGSIKSEAWPLSRERLDAEYTHASCVTLLFHAPQPTPKSDEPRAPSMNLNRGDRLNGRDNPNTLIVTRMMHLLGPFQVVGRLVFGWFLLHKISK